MISRIHAIDVHAHFGEYQRSGNLELANRFASADAETVVRRASEAKITTTIASPLSGLLPRGTADSVHGNTEASESVEATPGLLQWVIVNPLQPKTYQQAADLLRRPKCVGIKLHPEEHEYPIAEHGRELFEFASKHGSVVLVHSGDPLSLPSDFLPFANAFSNISIILAHLGNGGGAAGDPTLQVRAIEKSQHGNLFTDTSSARSISPGLIEWAVQEIGPDRILFGTDTPLYHAAMHRARIDHADISDGDKMRILRDNAIEMWSSELFEKNEA
jgi:uncharacterized protein